MASYLSNLHEVRAFATWWRHYTCLSNCYYNTTMAHFPPPTSVNFSTQMPTASAASCQASSRERTDKRATDDGLIQKCFRGL